MPICQAWVARLRSFAMYMRNNNDEINRPSLNRQLGLSATQWKIKLVERLLHCKRTDC
jgi:hypothetical protein